MTTLLEYRTKMADEADDCIVNLKRLRDEYQQAKAAMTHSIEQLNCTDLLVTAENLRDSL